MPAGEADIVCIVDDDEGVREALDSLLRSAGLQPVVFASAEDFLRAGDLLLRTRCLVLDLRMPGMSGQELQRHLVADGRDIAVIILTAHGDGEMRDRSLAAGAVAFLSKPVSGAMLLDAVETALAKRGGEVHAPTQDAG